MNEKIVVNGEFPAIINALGDFGVDVVAIKPNPYLPKPVAAHVDMNYFILCDRLFVAGGAHPLDLGLDFIQLDRPGDRYPKDVICNAKLVGEHLFCNCDAISDVILSDAMQMGYTVINVRQGYTGCSICKVADNAIITSDYGIAAAAKENKIDVLIIDNREIILPGYDVGFIGGCTGLMNSEKLLFTGSLSKCCFGKSMKEFCLYHGVDIIELIDGPPVDVGGFLVLHPQRQGGSDWST